MQSVEHAIAVLISVVSAASAVISQPYSRHLDPEDARPEAASEMDCIVTALAMVDKTPDIDVAPHKLYSTPKR